MSTDMVVPNGLTAEQWAVVMARIDELYESSGYVTATALSKHLGVDEETSKGYMDALLASGDWETEGVIARNPHASGRPENIREMTLEEWLEIPGVTYDPVRKMITLPAGDLE